MNERKTVNKRDVLIQLERLEKCGSLSSVWVVIERNKEMIEQ